MYIHVGFESKSTRDPRPFDGFVTFTVHSPHTSADVQACQTPVPPTVLHAPWLADVKPILREFIYKKKHLDKPCQALVYGYKRLYLHP